MFRRIQVLMAFAGAAFIVLTAGVSAKAPILVFTVTPEPTGKSVTVAAEFELGQVRAGQTLYVRDFGQLVGAELWIDGVRKNLAPERKGDDTLFRGLPRRGKARLVYTLDCVTRPEPNYRKRLMGGPGFVMARLGLFAAITGRECEPVSVSWTLPEGWTLAIGSTGVQTWTATQETIWLAGQFSRQRLQNGTDAHFDIAVLNGTGPAAGDRCVNAAKAVFRHAWSAYGPLPGKAFSLAVFPKGTIGGGTALGSTLVTEDDPITTVHELLHWWSNPGTPAWFREGVHTYMAAALLKKVGWLDEAGFRAYLETRLAQHQSVVRNEGAKPLAVSSADYDAGRGGGDMYGLMPVFAYRLDREIQKETGYSLEDVYTRVLRERDARFNIERLIFEVTGYNAGPIFRRWFDQVIPDPEELLLDEQIG